MSADPNESGDFDDFFQSGERGIYEGGPAKLKTEPVEVPSDVEDWGVRPHSPEMLARQARLRRLVVAIVLPLGVASLALFAARLLRTPEAERAAIGVVVGAARPAEVAPQLVVAPAAPARSSEPKLAVAPAAPAPNSEPKLATSVPAPTPNASSVSTPSGGERPPAPPTAAARSRARSEALVKPPAPKAAVPDIAPRWTRTSEVPPTAAFPVEAE